MRLVGRERELATALEVVDSALAGAGGILFLTGEPGIGKTRLTAELRRHVEDAPAPAEQRRPLWIEGRCVSYGESMPYWPFRDLLRSWLGVLADEPELRVRLALRRTLDGLFGARLLEVYPYLGAMLGLSLEPEAREPAGRALTRGPPVPHVRRDPRAAGASRARRAGLRRPRGPPLGRPDLAPAARTPARGHRDVRAAARPVRRGPNATTRPGA